MEKEFVSYEQALALKELGFDEPCFGYYEPNGELDYIENHILKDFSYLIVFIRFTKIKKLRNKL